MYKLTIKSLLAFALIISSTIVAAQSKSYWKVENSAGNIYMLELKIKGNRFEAHTRKNCIKQAMGYKKYILGRLFGQVKQSEILYMKGSCSQIGDTTILRGNYSSIYSNQNVHFKLLGDSLFGYTYRVDTLKHYSHGVRLDNNTPLNNYEQIVDSAFKLTEKNIYNSELMNHKKWEKFKQKTQKISKKCTDNWDLQLSYGYAAHTSLPFTHYGITRTYKSSKERHFEYPIIEELKPEIALLKIKSFSGPKYLMDSTITQLKKKDYKHLIIDLRDNRGGTVEMAMPLVQYLAKKEIYGGVFLTRKWFDKHDHLPKIEDYKNFIHFTDANFSLIIDGIHKQEALCLKVIPEKDPYKGNIYILTNNITASTCEPLVYGLKANKMATVIGENTAGAMLNGEIFPLGSGLQLWIPTADYYTVDGKRLDKTGVEPNIEVESKEALNKALEIITKKQN